MQAYRHTPREDQDNTTACYETVKTHIAKFLIAQLERLEKKNEGLKKVNHDLIVSHERLMDKHRGMRDYQKLQRVCDCAEKKAQLIKESLCEPDKVLIYVEALQRSIKESKK